ncbi:MAG: anthranilate phosphoribosyltransferase [Anaerolineaceae bacterium]|nr:anthranilate phosphoribosyltransferase [Anaerolineaceae bacterium]
MKSFDIRRAIDILSRFGQLDDSEAEAVMLQIMQGGASPSQIAAYLMALRMKGETISEITGSVRAMRSMVHEIPTSLDRADLLDTCGSGGDFSGTYNISTTVAFIAAGAGLKVAKHGNRAASSQAGSADVLAELGVALDLSPEQLALCLEEIGIAFLFAANLHPAMKNVIVPRKELGIRTIFNIIGPLTNPAGAGRQLMGIFAPDLTDLLASTLAQLGAKRAMVVCGYGNMDELTTTGPNKISHYDGKSVRQEVLNPADLGFRGCSIYELLGGDAPANAVTLRGILSGDILDARRDVAILNAAAALWVGGAVDSMKDGCALATQVIDGGAALAKLDALIDRTQQLSQQTQ